MIRVLHSVSIMNRAGIETMLMNYYRCMDRTKVQFDFLTSRSEPGDYDSEIKALGGNIYRSPTLNPLFYGRYQRYMKQLFQSDPRIKILHAHNEGMALYALNGAKAFGIANRIAHAHNTQMVKDYKWPLKAFCKQFLRYSANRFWGCSNRAGVYFFGKKNWAAKGFLLHNAIETEKFKFNPAVRQTLRATLSLNSCPLIGMVGRFNPQKNHAKMLGIFAELLKLNAQAKLVFIGEGQLEPKIKKLAKKMGLQQSIIFAGQQSNVEQWYQAMDALVMPSRFEGLPVVGVEAQAAGLPCIFSKAITPEVLLTENAKSLSLRQSNAAWAKAIYALLKAPTNRENGAEAVQNAGYDIHLEAKKLEKLYLTMAGEDYD